MEPSNIYYIEFMVNDLRLFKVPDSMCECDPVVFEFRYLDKVMVSLVKDQYDITGTNYGKNCLFTMNSRPDPDIPIEFEVYKDEEPNFISIGKGTIRFDENINNLVTVSLPDNKSVSRIQSGTQSQKASENASVGNFSATASVASSPVQFPITQVMKAWHPIIGGPAARQTRSAQSLASQGEGSEYQVGVFLLRMRLTCFGPSIVSTLVPNKEKVEPTGEPTGSVYKCDQVFGQFPNMSSGSKHKRHRSKNHYPEEPATCCDTCQNCQPRDKRRRSRSTNRHRNRSCERSSSRHRNRDVVCNEYEYGDAPRSQSADRDRNIDCQTQDNLRNRSPGRNRSRGRRGHRHVGKRFSSQNICKCQCQDMYINPPTLSTCEEKMDRDKDDFLPAPPASTTDFGKADVEFDEYRTSCYENELIIRVPKNSRQVCRLTAAAEDDAVNNICECKAEPTDSVKPCTPKRLKKPNSYCMTVQDSGNDMVFCTPCQSAKVLNSTNIPTIRGNLKHPVKYEVSNKLGQCSDRAATFHPPKSDPRNCCIECEKKQKENNPGGAIPYPEGIRVCKKFSANPNIDVYVLKLPGKMGADGSLIDDKVELELHTPKSPTAPLFMETSDAQTYEEDFCEPYKAVKSKGGGDKGKKGKK